MLRPAPQLPLADPAVSLGGTRAIGQCREAVAEYRLGRGAAGDTAAAAGLERTTAAAGPPPSTPCSSFSSSSSRFRRVSSTSPHHGLNPTVPRSYADRRHDFPAPQGKPGASPETLPPPPLVENLISRRFPLGANGKVPGFALENLKYQNKQTKKLETNSNLTQSQNGTICSNGTTCS